MSRAAFRTVAGVVGVLACGVPSGCGSIWTYDEALQKRIRDQGYAFEPPDSEAFVPPAIPPVYDVVFTEDIISTRDSLEVAASHVPLQVMARDTVFIFLPETAAETSPAEPASGRTVRVELSPAEQAALLAKVDADVKRAESLLTELRAKNDPRAASEQWDAAWGFLLQARSALDQKNFSGAANLAEKARLLAENLATPRP